MISILTMVTHKVPEVDKRSTTGFGSFQLSVLAVATVFFDPTWLDSLTEQEREQVEVPLLELNQVVLAYLCAVTQGLKAGSGEPVFVNGSHRTNDGKSYSPTSPSLQMLVDLLADLIEDTQELASEYNALVERLEDGGELTAADMARLQSFAVAELSYDNVRPAYAARHQLYLSELCNLSQ